MSKSFVKIFNKVIDGMNVRDITVLKRYAYVIAAMYSVHTKFITHGKLYFKKDDWASIVTMGVQKSLIDDCLHYLDMAAADGVSSFILEFFDEFAKLKNTQEKNAFCEYLDYVIDRFYQSYKDTPLMSSELIGFISVLIQQNDLQKVYNPFCGNADLAITLGSDTEYLGYETDKIICFISNICLDVHNCLLSRVEDTNPLTDWCSEDYECVVSLPHFNVSELNDYFTSLNGFMERFYFPSIDWGKKMSISIVPMSFLSAEPFGHSRGGLISGTCRMDVIKLPASVISNTSVPVAMLVVYYGVDYDGYIHFIDGRTCTDAVENVTPLGTMHDSKFNSNKLLELLNTEDGANHFKVEIVDVLEREEILLSDIYASSNLQLTDGQMSKSFEELFAFDNTAEPINGEHDVLSNNDFSADIYNIRLRSDVKLYTEKSSTVSKVHGPHLVFMKSGNKILLYKHTMDTDLYINRFTHLAFRVNTNDDMDYLCLTLINSEHFSSVLSAMARPRLLKVDLKLFNRISFPIYSDIIRQRETVEAIFQAECTFRDQERKAERNRLGMKQVSSDIAHMLGTAFSNQKSIEACLRRYDPSSEKYRNAVSKLLDIMNYVQRTIVNFGNDINSSSFRFKDIKISDFVHKYVNAWSNFGVKCYDVEVDDSLITKDLFVTVDKDSLLVLFDTIFDNAYRHGFMKQYSESNSVKISLSYVHVDGKPFCMLSFANNGEPMPDGFTVRDFITKGRFSAASGRSGLGGYHIYTIVKGNNGYIGILSSKDYPFILNILLPIAEVSLSISNLLCSTYEGKLL